MSHIHKFEKNKGQSNFDADGLGVLAVKNVSNSTLSFGNPPVNLYPGDEGFSCDDNEKVISAAKKGLVKIQKQDVTRQKPKKQKQEETSVTVAETEQEPSVQLDSPEQDEASLDTQF